MRIVILNTLYPPHIIGGAEKSVSLLAEALARRGDSVAVITLYPGSEEVCETRNGVRVYRLPLDNIPWPFGATERLPLAKRLEWHLRDMWNRRSASRVGAILDIEKPDVLHSNNLVGFSVSVWREARRRKIRLIHTLRDYTLACFHSGFYRRNRVCERQCADCRMVSIVRKAQSDKVDGVVSNSAYLLKAHQVNGFFKSVPAGVIYNIADLDRNIGSGGDDQRSQSDGLTFGFIGLIDQRKGIEVVLNATRLLSNTSWRLKIAGKGIEGYLNELKARFPDERIEWVGFVESKEFYRSIDVTLIASVWPEPLPRTLIETFAFGRSAICARSGGIPEIMGMGKVVESYDPQSAEELASIMNRALSDPGRWREGGFRDESAKNLFTELAVTDKYRAAYRGGSGFPLRDAAEQVT